MTTNSYTYSRTHEGAQGERRYVLAVDGEADILFTGTLLASASSRDARPFEDPDRWSELYIFKTAGENFIGQIVGCSSHPGERSRSRAEAHPTVEALLPMFSRNGNLSWLTKQLLHDASLDIHVRREVA